MVLFLQTNNTSTVGGKSRLTFLSWNLLALLPWDLTTDLFGLVSALFVQDLVADLFRNVLALHVGRHAALLQLDALALLSGCPPGVGSTVLPWHLATLLTGNIPAVLPGDGGALLAGHILAVLSGDQLTPLV